MKLRTIVLAGAGVAAGMVAANYLTDGAVKDATIDFLSNAKDKFFTKSSTVMEVANDAVDAVVDTAETVAESL